jgi:pyruvate dehydrogenase E1 component subunit alpha
VTSAATVGHDLYLLSRMLLVRRFEERCIEAYSAGKIRGFMHTYVGEEAVGTGVMEALEDGDAVVSNYREHGHALLRGISPGAVMAEMYGKREGCSRGRGGSMHLFDARSRFYGGNAIVGGGIPLAVGLALAQRMRKETAITGCFFGDGAVAEGAFHESMNLAALWKLPVLFVCENNLYAMGTRLDLYQSNTDLRAKAASYGMAAEAVDGMDVEAVETAAKAAAAAVRAGSGPRFLECRTYRFRAHSMYDPELYRTKREVENWKRRDPIALQTARLKERGILGEGDLARLEREAGEAVDAAVAFAEAGTLEPVEELTRFVYSERTP